MEDDDGYVDGDFDQFRVGEVEAASDAKLVERETEGQHQDMGCLGI